MFILLILLYVCNRSCLCYLHLLISKLQQLDKYELMNGWTIFPIDYNTLSIIMSLYFLSVCPFHLFVYFHFIDYAIDSVVLSHNASSVPVIGSSTVYTFTCTVTISCDGTCSADTLTMSWSLNGNSVTSATHTESSDSSFAVSGDGPFTSTLTTVGDISSSHAGEYQCDATLTNAVASDSNTTDFNVKRKYYQIY